VHHKFSVRMLSEVADNELELVHARSKLCWDMLQANSAWLDAPASLLLPHNGRTFDVRVDPTSLPPGLHYDELEAWDAAAEWRGPLARIPITLCRPHVLPPAADGTYSPSRCVGRPTSCWKCLCCECLDAVSGCTINQAARCACRMGAYRGKRAPARSCGVRW
jgi:hypothetical protein